MTDQEHQDVLHSKLFQATQRDRKQQTSDIVSKLDELKPLGSIEVSNFPEPPEVDLSTTNELLQEIKDELSKPLIVTLRLK